jgi:putative phosphoribosyl transferase
MFRDRTDAGERLAVELRSRGYGLSAVVLGIPRGGVEVAAAVAGALEAPLDIVVVRKIGSPGNPEFAAGAVDPDGHVIANPDADASDEYLRHEGAAERREALRRIAEYRGGRPEPILKGRDAIVVDDGIATGLTALAALRWLRGKGAARVILAVPVISPSAARMLVPEVDDLVALEVPLGFQAVGAHYARFGQLTDAEVKALLAGARL